VSETTRRWLAWAPAVAWAATIFMLSSQPRLPSLPGVGDKQGHAFTFGVLAVLCLAGLTGARLWKVNRSLVMGAFALAVLYGVSDEVHQSFVPGRTPDVEDLLADALGAAVALGAAWASAILLRRRNLAPRT
jgi:VanZ family protein